jgi:hypothetical protein
MFVIIALVERNNDKREKEKYRSAEGAARQLRNSLNVARERIQEVLEGPKPLQNPTKR